MNEEGRCKRGKKGSAESMSVVFLFVAVIGGRGCTRRFRLGERVEYNQPGEGTDFRGSAPGMKKLPREALNAVKTHQKTLFSFSTHQFMFWVHCLWIFL